MDFWDQRYHGDEFLSNFGSSLTSGRFDSGRFNDLAVGAPLSTIERRKSNLVETGMVFIYYNPLGKVNMQFLLYIVLIFESKLDY